MNQVFSKNMFQSRNLLIQTSVFLWYTSAHKRFWLFFQIAPITKKNIDDVCTTSMIWCKQVNQFTHFCHRLVGWIEFIYICFYREIYTGLIWWISILFHKLMIFKLYNISRYLPIKMLAYYYTYTLLVMT